MSIHILWDSNSPVMKTGYGMQTAIFTPRIKALGHEVTIFGYAGNQHTEIEWNGIRVLPAGAHAMGMDVIGYHYEQSGADVVIALTDCWAMSPQVMAHLPTVCWTPVDNEPLGHTICTFLDEAQPRVVAIAEYGQRMFNKAAAEGKFSIPHRSHTFPMACRWTCSSLPRTGRDCDAESGIDDDTFMVILNQANRSGLRKALPEQILAFLRFHERHPDSRLLLHMAASHAKGQNLPLLIDRAKEAYGFTIPEGTICFPDQGVYNAAGSRWRTCRGFTGLRT